MYFVPKSSKHSLRRLCTSYRNTHQAVWLKCHRNFGRKCNHHLEYKDQKCHGHFWRNVLTIWVQNCMIPMSKIWVSCQSYLKRYSKNYLQVGNCISSSSASSWPSAGSPSSPSAPSSSPAVLIGDMCASRALVRAAIFAAGAASQLEMHAQIALLWAAVVHHCGWAATTGLLMWKPTR